MLLATLHGRPLFWGPEHLKLWLYDNFLILFLPTNLSLLQTRLHTFIHLSPENTTATLLWFPRSKSFSDSPCLLYPLPFSTGAHYSARLIYTCSPEPTWCISTSLCLNVMPANYISLSFFFASWNPTYLSWSCWKIVSFRKSSLTTPSLFNLNPGAVHYTILLCI